MTWREEALGGCGSVTDQHCERQKAEEERGVQPFEQLKKQEGETWEKRQRKTIQTV